MPEVEGWPVTLNFMKSVLHVGGGSSSKAQLEHDFCLPWGRKPMERKDVTGDGIPEFYHFALKPSPSVAELSGDVRRSLHAPVISARPLGLAQAERDLPDTDDESMLNKFPGRQQSFRHRSMTRGCERNIFKGIRQRKGIRGFLVEIRPHKWKKTIWLGTYNTAEEAGGAYDAGIFYTGKTTKYNFPELKGTFPPLPSPFRLESADDVEEIKTFVQQQAREAACRAKNKRMKGESTNLWENQRRDEEMKICEIKTEAEPSDAAATTTDRSGGFQSAPHVEAVSQSQDLQLTSNQQYAVGRMRSCDAIDEDDLMSRLAPSTKKQVEDAIMQDRSVPVNDDDLISRLAPFIRKEVEEALNSTLRPLVSALRSREENEQKHREKLLTLETQKLALKRAKLLIERQRVARHQPHPRASSHSGNRMKKNSTTR